MNVSAIMLEYRSVNNCQSISKCRLTETFNCKAVSQLCCDIGADLVAPLPVLFARDLVL